MQPKVRGDDQAPVALPAAPLPPSVYRTEIRISLIQTGSDAGFFMHGKRNPALGSFLCLSGYCRWTAGFAAAFSGLISPALVRANLVISGPVSS